MIHFHTAKEESRKTRSFKQLYSRVTRLGGFCGFVFFYRPLRKERKEMFYLTMHSTQFIQGFIASYIC